MNLYWVNNEIYKLYSEFIDPETGEITDSEAFEAKYKALDLTREEVIENTLLMYKNAISDVAALDAEIKNLQARKSALEKTALRAKQDAADALNGEKFSTAKVSVSWRKSKSANVDEAKCPAEYLVTKEIIQPDKKKILADLKAGKEISGCELVETNNIQIK